MQAAFPGAVPEIPVSDIDAALQYYARCLGFSIDWGEGGGGIAGISRMDHVGIVVDDLEYRVCSVRGPEGIIVALTEQLG